MKKLKKHILHSIQPMTRREDFVARGQERHFDKINEIVEWINNHDKETIIEWAYKYPHTIKVKAQQEKECPHDHLCCPGDIRTVQCAYCGKSMYYKPL